MTASGVLAALSLAVLLPRPVCGQAQPAPDAGTAPGEATVAAPTTGTVVRFLGGAALGLGLHEGGHLVLDVAFGADPGLRPVSFGGVPFFAISHDEVTPAQEYAIASAGFWMQHASSEWLLTRRPNLRHERAAMAKGLLAFNVLASVAYGAAALAETGPLERDTYTMARELGIDEGWVGVMVLTPAALDVWRYYQPDSRTARWASRTMKVALVLLTFRAAAR